MGVFEQLDGYGYGNLHLCCDPKSGLRAVIAVHDVRLGAALGGCRFVSYDETDAAVLDALRLGRAMTFKAALAGLPHGGGKAVIMRPTGTFDREQLFERFGEFVDSLGGQYITTEDSGTSVEDLTCVRRKTRFATGFSEQAGGSGDPSPFTALGVRRGIEACVAVALERETLEGIHVAVQGVGHVGFALCRELKQLGAQLTVADTNSRATEQVREELGAEVVAPSAIHRTECDVFAPCALGGAINAQTLPELRCRVIAGAANNQLASPELGAALLQRGIVYAPDYAINAGGLIHVAQEWAGYDANKTRNQTLAIFDTVKNIVVRAREREVFSAEVADAMVAERLQQAG